MARKRNLDQPDTLAEVDENGVVMAGTEAEMRERVSRENDEHEAVMACVRALQDAGEPVTDATVAAMMERRAGGEEPGDDDISDLDEYEDGLLK